MFKEFWQLYVKGYGRLPMALGVCGLALAISVLEGLNIGLLVPLVESFQDSGQGGEHWITRVISSLFARLGIPLTLKTILFALSVLILGAAGLKYVKAVLAGKLRQGYEAWIKSRYMWTLLNADLSYFHDQKLGVLTDRLTIQSDQAANVLDNYIELLTHSALVTAYLVGAFAISPYLTAIAFAMMLMVSGSMQYFIRRAAAGSRLAVLRSNAFHVAAVETLSGIHVIKSFLLEQVRWTDFDRMSKDVGEVRFRLGRNHSRMQVLQEHSMFALIAGILFIGVSILGLGIAVIIALLFVLYRLTPKVTAVNGLRQNLAENGVAQHTIVEAIRIPAQVKIVSGQKPFEQLETGIELRDVTFSYNGGADVLCGTNFRIDKGQMTAIVGASGAGKSTLIDMLLRFYDPVEGSVMVDGVDLRELDLTDWRKCIGVVSQDTYLFNDTVAYNIGLDQPGVTEEA